VGHFGAAAAARHHREKRQPEALLEAVLQARSMAAISVVGAGMMGSSLCVPLADRGHDVRLIGTPLDDSIVHALQTERRHPKLGVELPASVRCSLVRELESAAESADAFVLGVSSAGVGWAAQALAPLLARRARPVLMLSKGLEYSPTGLSVLSDAFAAGLPAELQAACQPVAVCGPCIAGELARRVPTVVVFTGRELEPARRFAEWIETPYYRAVVEPDVVGAQVCAALKNAYAMGVAFAAGLHQRAHGERGSIALHNYEAAVFAQALLETRALVVHLGGSSDTALGLAGSGDLTVTCNGGRTGRFGALLGAGRSSAEAIVLMQGATLECLEVLSVLERYLSGPSHGRLERRALPLLSHLIEVGLHGAAVSMPFGEFFRA
jgi:glycerol-3-phosphate dehydrogenase (NAD(P)+)